MQITVRVQQTDSDKLFARLRDKGPIAIRRAVNRAIGSSQTLMARSISQDTGLKVSTVKASLPVEQATLSRFTARLSAGLKRIPLIDFKARGPEPSRGKGRGVTAGLKGGRRRYPNAFIATMRSGHRGVFTRKGQSRSRKGRPAGSPALPIVQLYGPSLGRVFAKFIPLALRRGEEQLAKNLQHELRFASTTVKE